MPRFIVAVTIGVMGVVMILIEMGLILNVKSIRNNLLMAAKHIYLLSLS